MGVGDGRRSHLRGTCTGNLRRGWVMRDRIRPQTAEWGAPSLRGVCSLSTSHRPPLPNSPAEGSGSPESLSPGPYRRCHHSSAPGTRCSFWKPLLAVSAGRVLGAPAARTVFSRLLCRALPQFPCSVVGVTGVSASGPPPSS